MTPCAPLAWYVWRLSYVLSTQNDLEALEIRTREREAKGDQDLTMAAARYSMGLQYLF